ncbi:MAG: toxin-antitoxin system, antitoxin component [Candidatus Omnitrophica bacterium]|nr:toxin-antitoxin system, antitoxin component [Candidatus Omnitrophota bacterium]
MAQLTIYIDEDTLSKIGHSARRDKASVSAWVKKRLVASLETKGWPPGYFDCFGRLKDVNIKVPDELSWKSDVSRAVL